MYLFFVMHVPEYGRMSVRNMLEVYGVYSIFWYI
jgi:hypothetical protein